MTRPNIICLAIDRLHVGYLGAYGNTWVSTPTLDRLASESFLLNRMTIDSPELETLYRSLWSGFHALAPQSRIAGNNSLMTRFAASGWHTTLITDDRAVSSHPLTQTFGEQVLVDHATRSNEKRIIADEIEETDAAIFFAEANNWLEKSIQQPFLLWLHTGVLGRLWDAPLEFRAQYHDEDDPSPEDWATVPNYKVTENTDPDELLGIRNAYAGQVSLVDQLVGSLIEAIDQSQFAANTLLVVFSPRGFPLAEHYRIGSCDNALYAELTHVPCIIRLPSRLGAGQRSQALVQPSDIFATLLDLALPQLNTPLQKTGFGSSIMPLIRGEVTQAFDRVCTVQVGEIQYRVETPAWAMRVAATTPTLDKSEVHPVLTQQTELFVKPDDWCEINEVSNRCPKIVEQMQSVLAEFGGNCKVGGALSSTALSSELISGLG